MEALLGGPMGPAEWVVVGISSAIILGWMAPKLLGDLRRWTGRG